MNLDGGVTSPGMPRKPLPAPNEESFIFPSVLGLVVPGLKIDVIIQIGHMPVKTGRIGKYS